MCVVITNPCTVLRRNVTLQTPLNAPGHKLKRISLPFSVGFSPPLPFSVFCLTNRTNQLGSPPTHTPFSVFCLTGRTNQRVFFFSLPFSVFCLTVGTNQTEHLKSRTDFVLKRPAYFLSNLETEFLRFK